MTIPAEERANGTNADKSSSESEKSTEKSDTNEKSGTSSAVQPRPGRSRRDEEPNAKEANAKARRKVQAQQQERRRSGPGSGGETGSTSGFIEQLKEPASRSCKPCSTSGRRIGGPPRHRAAVRGGLAASRTRCEGRVRLCAAEARRGGENDGGVADPQGPPEHSAGQSAARTDVWTPQKAELEALANAVRRRFVQADEEDGFFRPSS